MIASYMTIIAGIQFSTTNEWTQVCETANMKMSSLKRQEVTRPGKEACIVVIVLLGLLAAPIMASALEKPAETTSSASGNFSTIFISGANATAQATSGNNTIPASKAQPAPGPQVAGIQARAASDYLASRAATGLQLKQRTSGNHKPASTSEVSTSNRQHHRQRRQAASALGDPVGLDTALDAQWDMQMAAGEHKKYILVKKKPKHKKIKMEVYKPKMKYKKIKMKVPVKKMKKKKVKGYLVKKEKHY